MVMRTKIVRVHVCARVRCVQQALYRLLTYKRQAPTELPTPLIFFVGKNLNPVFGRMTAGFGRAKTSLTQKLV